MEGWTKRFARIGLCTLAFLFWTLPGAAQEGEMPPWANCEICKSVFEEVELVKACDYTVVDWSQGAVFILSLKKPELMPRFRALEAKDKALAAKFSSMDSDERAGRLCPLCTKYFDLLDRGLIEERIQTPTGSVTLVSANNQALQKDLHAFTESVRQAVASFDKEMPAGKPQSSEKAPAKVPDFMLKEMEKCYLCKLYLDAPEMMTMAKCEIIKLNNGMAMISTVKDRNCLEKFQDFEKSFHEKIEELYSQSSFEDAQNKLCQYCRKFGDLGAQGAIMDWSLTESGSVAVFVSDKEDLVKKIHALADLLKSLESMFSEGTPK